MFKKKARAENIKCLNCETSFSGWFCPECGQPSTTKRLTVIQVIKNFLDALSDSEKGFLRTAIDLSQHPGNMLKDYITGKRKRYLSAGRYTFFLIVMFTVNISLLEHHYGIFRQLTIKFDGISLDFDNKNLPASKKEVLERDYKDSKGIINVKGTNDVLLNFELFGKKINKVTTKQELLRYVKILLPEYHRSLFNFLKFFLALWIPIFSLYSFIFYRKENLNLAEHITVNSYIYSHILLIFIVFSPLYIVLPGLKGTTLITTFIASSFFLIFSYLQIFQKGQYKLLKCLFVTGTSYLTYLLILTALLAVQVIYVGVQNIDKL